MISPVRQAFVGAGANLGEREATLRGALERLRSTPGVQGLEMSACYETEPVGETDQPMFLNAVAGLETVLSPEQLLERLLAIEQEFGRVRTARWGPRTLDLDLLDYEGETRNSASLQLPHPRMLERGFVVIPLLEVLARPRFVRAVWAPLQSRLAGARPAGRVVRLG